MEFGNSGAIAAGYGVSLTATSMVTLAAGDYIETFLAHNFGAAVSLICEMTLCLEVPS